MAAEYSAAVPQTVASNQPVVFPNNTCPCNQGLIFKKSGGVFLLASNASGSRCPCGCGCRQIQMTDYQVGIHMNVQVPEGEEEYTDGGASGDQGYGRAIRTTPGISGGYSGANGGGQTGNGRSMRGGTAMRSGGRTAYSGSGMRSGKRDSMGRYSGAAEQEIFDKLRKMADMTPDHDEREFLKRTIDRLKAEEDE